MSENIMNVDGNWKGVLKYGRLYGKHQNKELNFELSFRREGNTISGKCQDKHGFGSNKYPAEVQGVVEGKNLRFIKRYEVFAYFDNSYNLHYDVNKKGPPIFYEGTADKEGIRYEGTWHILTKVKLWGFIPWTIKSKGTFFMERM
jgi:hypothetical protein